MPYINAVPKEIYIGQNCSETNKKHLIKIGKELNISVFQMSTNDCGEKCELISQKVL